MNAIQKLLMGAVLSPSLAAAQADLTINGLIDQAKKGDTSAMLGLAFSYDTGDGVPKDQVESVKWLRLAAEQGHATAQIMLGVRACYGLCLHKDWSMRVPKASQCKPVREDDSLS